MPASKGKKGNGRTEKTTNSKGRTTSKSQTSKARASKEQDSKRTPAPKNKNTAQANAKTEENAMEKESIIGRAIGALKKRKKDLQRENSPVRNEYRFNHQTKHTVYNFEERDGKYKGVGLTTKATTFGRKNMPLKKNPKKGDDGESYIRNGYVIDSKGSYSSKVSKNYEPFVGDDKANVKSKIRHYKNEQRKKK